MSSFAFERVCKSYAGPSGKRVAALRDLTLDCPAGEFLVLLGSSGSGKTTLLRLAAGLEKPDSGQFTLNGRPAGETAANRDVAMVFQHPALYPHLTVEANIRLGLEIRHCPKNEMRERVGAAIELLGIADLTSRLPATLSGGQMQRVSLARAVARRPELLLLDEPLANLDGPARAGLKEKIRELQRATGATTVLVTHDQAEAFSLGRRVGIIAEGRILQVAPPRELYLQPENLAVAQFLARPSLNLLSGTISAEGPAPVFAIKPADGAPAPVLSLPEAALVRLAPYAGKPLLLSLRPENIRLIPEGQGMSPGLNEVEARLERIEDLGGFHDYYFQATGYPLVARTLHPQTLENPCVRIALDLGHAVFFDPVTGNRV